MEESKDLSSRSQLEMYSCGHEDRISSLPDEVLLIILSFLTLKKMVKTSILSSRWENLWLNTPVLYFHAPSPIGSGVDNKKRKDYVVWVDHVLRQHKGRHLKEFKIGFYLNIDYQKDIDRWLEFALARKVEILELNFLLGGFDPINTTYNYAFPDCILKFCGGTANSNGNKQFDLKCLKSLQLKNVDVTGEAIDSFLLNCPFLERLEVVRSRKLVTLVISDPILVLKYLQIKHCLGLTVLSISNFNLVSLDISSVEDLTLKSLSMLVELSIDGYAGNLNHSFFQAASCLSRLEALTLDAEKLKDVTQLPNLAQVTKLKRLVIKVKGWGDESLTMLLSFMKSCHHLEEFALELSQYIPERAIEAMCQAERLSSSSSLKVFEFRGYYGRVSDDELIMRVVENAPSLEKIIIETLALLMRKHNIGVQTTAREARSFASKKIEYLRESKCIPPHVNVLVR